MAMVARRSLVLGMTASLAGALSGCFGSFGATTALWRFNKGVSSNKWLQWLVFLAFVILPVYGLFVLGDVIVFNTIEFFSGSNPISAANYDVGHGRVLALTRDPADPNLARAEVRSTDGDKVTRQVFFIAKGESGFVVMDEQRRVLARVTSEGGLVHLFGTDDEHLLSMDQATMSSLTASIEAGASPAAVVEAHVRNRPGRCLEALEASRQTPLTTY